MRALGRRSVRRLSAGGRRRGGIAALVLLALVGCGDGGPEGPRTFAVTVTAPEALGAVVLEIDGRGIESLAERGATRLISGQTGPTSFRVVLVRETPGQLRFDVTVEDGGAAAPAAIVLDAVNGQNEPLGALRDVRVRFD